MSKLIYEVFSRYEGDSFFSPDEITHESDIYDNGYERFADYRKGSEYAERKAHSTPEEFKEWCDSSKKYSDERTKKSGDAIIEGDRLYQRKLYELGYMEEYFEPWEYRSSEGPNFTNDLYPAAFYTLVRRNYVDIYDDGVRPHEDFFEHDDGLLVDEKGQRGSKQVYIIKYHGEGEPWVEDPRCYWLERGEYELDENGVPHYSHWDEVHLPYPGEI